MTHVMGYTLRAPFRGFGLHSARPFQGLSGTRSRGPPETFGGTELSLPVAYAFELVDLFFGSGELFKAQESALFRDLLLLSRACGFQSAAAYEADDLRQLVAVEPCAVPLTAIDHDAGAMREVDAVHQLAAIRAGNVSHSARLTLAACPCGSGRR